MNDTRMFRLFFLENSDAASSFLPFFVLKIITLINTSILNSAHTTAHCQSLGVNDGYCRANGSFANICESIVNAMSVFWFNI